MRCIGLITVLLFCANVFAAGTVTFDCRHDDKIDPNLRQQMHTLTTRLLESMQNSDPNYLSRLLIDEVRQSPNFDVEVNKACQTFKPLVQQREFKIFTESHIISRGTGRYEFNIPSATKEKFTIHAERLSEETYICLMTSEKFFFDYMISIVYSKFGRDWRVQKIHIGLARVAGLSAVGWYNRSGELYNSKNIGRAFLALEVSRVLLRPSPFMQYETEKEVIDVYTKFSEKLHTKLYVRLFKMPSNPKLYNVTVQFLETEFCPKIAYVSHIQLADANSLKREAKALTLEIDQEYPGFVQQNQRVSYVVYKDIPSDPNKTYESNEFTLNFAQPANKK